MKRALLIMLLGALTLTTGCSKDDMATDGQTAQVSTEAADILAKGRVMCTDMDKLQLSCASSGANSPIIFKWDNNALSYVFNRSYRSYIQIEGNGCPGSKAASVNVPINVFSTASYTLKGSGETCFKYRIVVLGYDKGQLACESISPWQEFNYNNEIVPTMLASIR